MGKEVLYKEEKGIALITLNRPERRNAINQALLTYLFDYLDEVSQNDNIRAAIITGNGKSFCSGLDLAVVGKENLLDPRNDGKDLFDVFRSCKKPIIGAVNGHAITGGFELALNCDFLIGSENAAFADTHTKVGIHPGWGMSQLLQQAVGQRMAKQMSFTGSFISAETALRCGLLNEVVPTGELIPRATQIAEEISAIMPERIIMMKELIEYQNNNTLEESLKHERQNFREFIKSLPGGL